MTDIKVDLTIPGWSSSEKLERLGYLASQVPEYGTIVEVGTFCGRSAYVLGHNKHPTVSLMCVDMFPQRWMVSGTVAEYLGSESLHGDKSQYYSYETFMENVGNVPNLDTLRAFMPLPEWASIDLDVDLIFIDSTHDYENVKSELNMWYPRMKSNCTIIVDDYFDLFPGCIAAVDEFVKKNSPSEFEVHEFAAYISFTE